MYLNLSHFDSNKMYRTIPRWLVQDFGQHCRMGMMFDGN